jgi:hypothetical protein
MNILALLDTAIEELARETSSRTSRECGGKNSPTGMEKTPDPAKLPVLPVLPAEKQDIAGIGSESRYSDAQTASPATKNALKSIVFHTGSTGSTGTLKDFCGLFSSRDHDGAIDAAGSTGSFEDFRPFLDNLNPGQRFGDVPPRRWQQFLADARAFLDSGFAAQATALGWTLIDLFGCDDLRPFARLDKMGLIWLLHGDRLVAITADVAIIEKVSGARLTFRRQASSTTGSLEQPELLSPPMPLR